MITAVVGAAVFLAAVFLLMAFYGAAVVRAIQDHRYTAMKVRALERERAIRTDRLLWEVEQRTARAEQALRHRGRRVELHNWQREYSGY